jgi:RHS repeat-associated protein
MRLRSWVVHCVFVFVMSFFPLPLLSQDAVGVPPPETDVAVPQSVSPTQPPTIDVAPIEGDGTLPVDIAPEPEVVPPGSGDDLGELPMTAPSVAGLAATGVGSVQQVNDAPTPLPDRVGSGGDFTYRVDFDLPAFRNLVPNVGLVYNSNNRNHGGVENIVANGWRLTGFSSIERHSLGGGVPFYDDGQDVYTLDGAELMACRQGTTDTWVPKNGTARYYPLRYLTDTASGSCTAGGSFVTRIDDHRRIVYNTSTNAFEVTTPDGTQYIYRAVIYFLPTAERPLAGSDGYQVARNRKWLLQQIVDTFGNSVEVNYAVGTEADGFAERPLSVDYVGYKVRFYYGLLPNTAMPPQFGTGTAILGTQRYALASVTITNGGNPIRAYELDIDLSALTGTRLLARLRTFGSDYVLSGADVTSGSQLPPQDFQYTADTYTTTLKEYQGLEFHRNYTIADWDYTGVDNLIMLGGSFAITGRTGGSGGSGGDERLQFGRTLPMSRSTFEKTTLTRNQKANVAVPCYASYSPWPRFTNSEAISTGCVHSPKLSLLANDRLASPQVATTTASDYWESGSQNSNVRYTISTYNVTGPNASLISTSATPDSETQSADLNMAPLGNFDLDINSEIVGMEPGNDAVTAFTDGVMSGEAWQGSSRPAADTFAAIGDFDGNGVDDIFTTAASWISWTGPYDFVRTLPELGYFGNVSVKRGPGPSVQLARNTAVPMLGSTTLDYAATAFVDMNNDGLTDIAGYYRNDGQPDQINIQLSSGFGFTPIFSVPVQNMSGVPMNFLNNDFKNSVLFRDLNGDSLPEIIVNYTYNVGELDLSGCGTSQLQPFSLSSANCIGANAVRGSQALVLFRQGNSYRPISTLPSSASFPDFVDVGDFDGNGLLDMFLQSATTTAAVGPGRIMFGTSDVPNMLVRATNTLGGVTEVSYRTSPYNLDGSLSGKNQIPGAQMVVDKVVERDGRIGTSAITTRYDYADGRYDFFNRKNLGYGTITAYREAVSGGDAPTVVSTYLNDHIAEYGLLSSRVTKASDGTILQRTLNAWDVDKAGDGPYQVAKLQERVAVRYDNALIETSKAFTYSPYGAVATIRDYGRTTGDPIATPSNDLVDGNSGPYSDNSTTFFHYVPNTDAYIVNQPYAKRVQRGLATTADNTLLLAGEYYRYATAGPAAGGVIPCATASATAPGRSAICAVFEWNGGTGSTGFLRLPGAETDRDTRGNVVAQRDVKGNETRFAYDTNKNLFQTRAEITTGTSVNHINLTSWSEACQQPSDTTDPNGLITTIAYDTHCRETMRTAPNGHQQFTVYRSFGDADAQNIRRSSESASSALSYSWEYMDGFGRVWKTARSNGTSGTAGDGSGNPGDNALYELRRYDARGNLSWVSLPLLGTEVAGIGTSERTSFSYDTLDRLIKTDAADGTITTDDYGTWTFAHFGRPSIAYPSLTHTDALCNDNNAATSCRRFEEAFDGSGRKIRERRFDNLVVNGTDGVSAGSSPDRITQFGYDQLGQLIDVIDPAGALWSYTYDVYGNRTAANDPGLGSWAMEYDVLGNLIRQVDSKGQRITFSYDELNRVTLKIVGDPTLASRIETRFAYDQARAGFWNIGHETQQRVWSGTPGVGTLQLVERDYNRLGLVSQERHSIDGRTFPINYNYTTSGHLLSQNLPSQPGGEAVTQSGRMTYDTANRVISVTGAGGTGAAENLISNIDYNPRWGLPIVTTYGSGVIENASYSATRGWINIVYALYPSPSASSIYRAIYTRDLNGRITEMDTGSGLDPDGAFTYTYDYAGRLRSTRNIYLNTVVNQNFTYDRAGRLRSKGRPNLENTYNYPISATRPFHAPDSITPAGTGALKRAFVYDANGNMTAENRLNANGTIFANTRTMGYDGENRPLWVARAGKITCYVYGVDGTRLKKIEGLNDTGPTTNRDKPCTDMMPVAAVLPAGAVETVTFNQVEVRKWGTGNSEVITTYPHPNIRLIWTKGTAGLTSVEAQALHRDQLGSVRAVTTFKPLVTGAAVSTLRREAAIYKPFGEMTEVLQATQVNQEQKGWIGERYDADAGLQFLNARYYDPELGIFLQPDWFEVTAAGVGTNRYSYSFNDPVNKMDPGGNIAVFGGSDGHLIGNVDYGDAGWDSLQGGRNYGDPTATDWAELNNTRSGFNGGYGQTSSPSDGFKYQSNYYSYGKQFASIRTFSIAAYYGMTSAAEKFFGSSLGMETISRLLSDSKVLYVNETIERFNGPAYAKTRENEIYVNYFEVDSYAFKTQDPSFWGGGYYETAPVDVILGHEVGHATFGYTDEQYVVDEYENRYRKEAGYALRGRYDLWIRQ